ncbi:MAG: DNA repair protein RecO [Actinomycetota bacterium]
MPAYKEQGVVLRSVKLGEADKIVTVMTQGSGKVRAVAKGLRKTTSRFGARLEPFTHVSLMLYRGRGQLDTVTQAEIIAPHAALRDDLALFAAGRRCSRRSTRLPRSTSGTSAWCCCCWRGCVRWRPIRPIRPPSPSRSC